MYAVDNSVYTVQCVYIYNITVTKYYGISKANLKQCHTLME